MTENEKTTALIPSVGADGGQPPHNSTNQSIPHETCESNPPEENIEEMRERIRRMMLMYDREAPTKQTKTAALSLFRAKGFGRNAHSRMLY